MPYKKFINYTSSTFLTYNFLNKFNDFIIVFLFFFQEKTNTTTVVKKKGRKKNNEELSCTECDRVFTHRNSLVYHMRSHTGVRPHQCEQCGKSFFAASALKVHLRLHSGIYFFKFKLRILPNTVYSICIKCTTF